MSGIIATPSSEHRTVPRELSEKSTAKSKMKWRRKYVILTAVGLLLMLSSGIVYLVDPLQRIITAQTSVEEGSFAFEMWRKPPVSVFLYTYLFNITNAERFLSGEDKKLRVQQIGPYVYRELLENNVVATNSNGTVTFIPKYTLEFERELSVGDPEQDRIQALNMALLGAASILSKSSAVTNIALSSLTAYLNSQPVLNLTVHDLLWGYDDPLVRLGNQLMPGFINFERFGILDRMYASEPGGLVMTMRAGPNLGLDPNDPNLVLHDVFSLDTFNGSPGFEQWGYGKTMTRDPVTNRSVLEESPCNMVRGSLEGIMFPRNIRPENYFYVFRRAFCRTFPATFDYAGVGPGGFRSYYYKIKESILDPSLPNNACYCDKNAGDTCLPTGLSDMSPCYYTVPLALSMPHFLFGDTKLVEAIDGLKPEFEKHKSYLILQPDLGVPLEIHCRIQVNIAVPHTKMNPRVKPFNNLVIPVVYVDFTVRDLPQDIQNLMTLALHVGPVAQSAVIVLLALTGAAMLLAVLRGGLT